MAYTNATCRLIKPTTEETGENGAGRQHEWSELAEQRCSLRPLRPATAVLVLGRVGGTAYTCRLVSRERIAAGWRLQARLDGEARWREYTIREARRQGHWSLVVEGV